MVTARQTSSICPKSDSFIWKCVAPSLLLTVLHIRSFVHPRKKDYWLPIRWNAHGKETPISSLIFHLHRKGIDTT